MSALIMIKKSDGVELLSDAALCDPVSGTIGAIHSKMVPLPELNCVMAGRGPIPVLWITAYVAGLTSVTFDDVIAEFGAIRAAAATYNNGDVSAEDWARCEIALIGWSESRDRPEGYVSAGSYRQKDASEYGLEACNLRVLSGCSLELVDDFLKSIEEAPDSFDAETDGVAVMELMRQAALSDGERRCVGGYLEKAAVTRDGVQTQVIYEWPDKVGHRIAAPQSMAFA